MPTLLCPDPAHSYNKVFIANGLLGEYAHCQPFRALYGWQVAGGVDVSLDKVVEFEYFLRDALDATDGAEREIQECLPGNCNTALPCVLCLLLLAAFGALGVWVWFRSLLQACRRLGPGGTCTHDWRCALQGRRRRDVCPARGCGLRRPARLRDRGGRSGKGSRRGRCR